MEIAEKDKAIGVMDSGVGGLTVLKQLLNVMPSENYLYFGDTKNLPYGEKTKEQLIEIVKEIFAFFEKQNVKAVVLDKSLDRIGVMATEATVNSKKYTSELKKNNPAVEVFEQACPKWVPIVENQIKDYDEKSVITGYLNSVLEFNPKKIILGCTHYPYLLDKLVKYAPEDLFINPALLFANYIKQDLLKRNILNTDSSGSVSYFASSEPDVFKKNAKLFLEIDSLPELVEL